MRILMVNKYLYPRAGAETYMLYVSEQLIKAGHELAFFGMDHPENTDLGPTATFPMLEFGPNQSTSDKLKNIATATVQRAMGDVSKKFDAFYHEFQPDIIHAHNVYNQMNPGLFLPYRRQTATLLTVHDFKPICPNYSLFQNGHTCTLCLKGSLMNCIKNRCCQNNLLVSTLATLSAAQHKSKQTYLRGYDRFIAPSQFMSDRLEEGGFPASSIHVVNNFASAPATHTPPGKGLLFAGRLCEEKGVHTLIDAYAKMPSPRPPLTIAGTGPLESALKQRAHDAGCTEIKWTGRVPPSQIETMLEECAVSIIPSFWFENCSIAIMESLAHGRPCIVSNSGGNPELIREKEDGWIFEAGNADSLRAVLQEVQQTSTEKLNEMGINAANIAKQRFSPPVHLTQILRIYNEALK